MEDRRKHARLDDERRISLILIPEHPQPGEDFLTVTCETRNISRTGIQFRTFHELPRNAFLRVDVPLADEVGRTLSLSGIVRWSRHLAGDDRYHVGVEFLSLDDEDHRLWVEYIRSIYG